MPLCSLSKMHHFKLTTLVLAMVRAGVALDVEVALLKMVSLKPHPVIFKTMASASSSLYLRTTFGQLRPSTISSPCMLT